MEIGGRLLRRRLRLQADRIEAVLAAQRFFLDRLLGELRVNAAAPKRQQVPHPGTPGRFDHVGLDFEVLQQIERRAAGGEKLVVAGRKEEVATSIRGQAAGRAGPQCQR